MPRTQVKSQVRLHTYLKSPYWRYGGRRKEQRVLCKTLPQGNEVENPRAGHRWPSLVSRDVSTLSLLLASQFEKPDDWDKGLVSFPLMPAFSLRLETLLCPFLKVVTEYAERELYIDDLNLPVHSSKGWEVQTMPAEPYLALVSFFLMHPSLVDGKAKSMRTWQRRGMNPFSPGTHFCDT